MTRIELRKAIARIIAPKATEIEGWHSEGLVGFESNLWSYALKQADEIMNLIQESDYENEQLVKDWW